MQKGQLVLLGKSVPDVFVENSRSGCRMTHADVPQLFGTVMFQFSDSNWILANPSLRMGTGCILVEEWCCLSARMTGSLG